MSDINLVRTHSLTVAQAKAIVQKAADDLSDEYNLVTDWRGNTLHFRRQGVDGRMQVTGSEIALDITLGLLLKPFKKRLLDHIEGTFDKLLAGSAKPSAKAKKGARRA